MSLCPNCQKKVSESLVKSKPYLVVKEALTQNEVEQGMPFTLTGKNKYGRDENTNAYYLAKEMATFGINFQQLSFTALWMHTPPKVGRDRASKEEYQKCLDWSISRVIDLAQSKRIVLLMGAEVVRTFTGYSVTEISGLVGRSDLFPVTTNVIACPNIDNMMKQPIGEMRLALKTFAEQIKIYEEYSKV